MHCTRIKLPGVGSVIVCGGRPRPKFCTACGRVAPFLCDWKTGKGETCDLPICTTHAQRVADDKHLCPKHSKAWAQWQAQRAPGRQPLTLVPK